MKNKQKSMSFGPVKGLLPINFYVIVAPVINPLEVVPMTDFDTMFEQAKNVRDKAYAPYSKFYVGCCIKSKKGHFYSGCNIENASYGLAACAEANAIAHMVVAGDTEIEQIMVLTDANPPVTPCGACRQRLVEFAMPETPIYICSPQGLDRQTTMGELLPDIFSRKDLPNKD